ncbi:hypothetical protein TNCV_336871 [Trichonephila clavipes]|nr:hypothetical protein TNCV_336871 [Trichonephila clavipes]
MAILRAPAAQAAWSLRSSDIAAALSVINSSVGRLLGWPGGRNQMGQGSDEIGAQSLSVKCSKVQERQQYS